MNKFVKVVSNAVAGAFPLNRLRAIMRRRKSIKVCYAKMCDNVFENLLTDLRRQNGFIMIAGRLLKSVRAETRLSFQSSNDLENRASVFEVGF